MTSSFAMLQADQSLAKCANPECDFHVLEGEYCPMCGPGPVVDVEEQVPADGAIRGPVVCYTAAGYAIWTEAYHADLGTWFPCERISQYFKSRKQAEQHLACM